MRKICTVCGKSKVLTDYYLKNKNKGRLHSQCKECYKEKRKLFASRHYEKYGYAYRERARKRNSLVKLALYNRMHNYLKNSCCEHCGITDIRVLEFDHIEPSLKKFSVSQGVNARYSWAVILEEIKKCRVLCANCHRIRTAE